MIFRHAEERNRKADKRGEVGCGEAARSVEGSLWLGVEAIYHLRGVKELESPMG